MIDLAQPAVVAALFASGFYLLVGQLTGVWKYSHIHRSEEARAPRYVDIAHRAALMYSFAALVIAQLAAVSAWSPQVNLIAVLLPVTFFGLAIGGYILHGALKDTDNQFLKPHVLGRIRVPGAALAGFMVALIAAEIGGVAVLFAGFLRAAGLI